MITVFVGDPNEEIQVDDVRVKIRDEYGISLDPKSFAYSGCNSCYGRGVTTMCVPRSRIDPDKLKEILEDSATRATVTQDSRFLKQQEPCYCVKRTHERVKIAIKTLEKEGGIVDKKFVQKLGQVGVVLGMTNHVMFVHAGYTKLHSNRLP